MAPAGAIGVLGRSQLKRLKIIASPASLLRFSGLRLGSRWLDWGGFRGSRAQWRAQSQRNEAPREPIPYGASSAWSVEKDVGLVILKP